MKQELATSSETTVYARFDVHVENRERAILLELFLRHEKFRFNYFKEISNGNKEQSR